MLFFWLHTGLSLLIQFTISVLLLKCWKQRWTKVIFFWSAFCFVPLARHLLTMHTKIRRQWVVVVKRHFGNFFLEIWGIGRVGGSHNFICHINQHVHFLPLPMNIRTNQIKSCPNLERLSLQNIRLNDAVAKLVLQLLIKPTLLRTWLTSWPSRDCENSEKSTYLPLEPQSWIIINDIGFNAICWQCCFWPCWALLLRRIY